MFEDPRDALLEELRGYDRNLRPLCHDFNDHQDVFACLRIKDHSFFGVVGPEKGSILISLHKPG